VSRTPTTHSDCRRLGAAKRAGDARCSGRESSPRRRPECAVEDFRVRGGPNVWVVRFGPRFSVTEEVNAHSPRSAHSAARRDRCSREPSRAPIAAS
jgi:hypothetical protein